MCGFAGIFLFKKFNEIEFAKMQKELTFRGPDQSGNYIDLINKIAFFHHRLSILDLSSAGKQPMESNSQRYVIAYNGEIYNHLEIRENIEKVKNIEWKGSSDTETLINSLEIIGVEKTLNICNGVFSFALWDKKNKSLLLARDKLGEKPLYYGFNNSIFYFGSDLSPFKNNKIFSPSIDPNALNLYANLNYIPSPYSIYKNIFKLEPGNYIKISQNNKNIIPIKYWSLRKSNYQDLKNLNKVEYFKFKIEESVKNQTISDVPIGSFLSGGIDSSLVSYFMQKNSMKRIKTFNISFNQQEYDESYYAKEISNYIGSDHKTFKISDNMFFDVVNKINKIYSEPFSDSSQIVTYLISKYAKKDVSVVLSGDGGDEGFAGYNRHILAKKINTFNKILPINLRKLIFKKLEKNNYKNLDRLIFYYKKFDKKININNIAHRYHKITRLLNSKDINELYLNFFINRESNFFYANNNNLDFIKNSLNLNVSSLNDILYYDAKYYLSDDIMCKVDRASMANSLETRMPLADANLINDTLNLDYNEKVYKNNNKYILKTIANEIFPTNLIDRPKMGFEIPLNNLLRTSFKQWSEDLIYSSDAKNIEFLNIENIKNKWQNHLKGNDGYHHELWNVLIFLNWSLNK